MVWGKHLIVDAAECSRGYNSASRIAEFARTLVHDIDMVAYGEPQVSHFGHEKPETSGYTLVQLIETSCITAHFCDINGDAYFDVFSCKEFDEKRAIRVIQEFFNPRDCTYVVFDRQAPSPEDVARLRAEGVKEMHP